MKTIEQKIVDRGCTLIEMNKAQFVMRCKCGALFSKYTAFMKRLDEDPSIGLRLSCGCISNRWTNERIDDMLIERSCSFKRQTNVDYINQPSTTKINWKCDKCHHTWQASVDQIHQSNSGCPSCAGQVPYTKDTLQLKLDSRGNDVTVLDLRKGTSKGGDRFATFECRNGHQWNALIYNVIKFGYGCPHCNYNVGKPSISSDGKKFHSSLERYAYEQFLKAGIQVECQKRYLPTRRLTCDFYIEHLELWVEVCGTSLLKRSNYASTIVEKERIVVDNLRQKFIKLTSFSDIDNFIKKDIFHVN